MDTPTEHRADGPGAQSAPDARATRARLDTALRRLAVAFRGSVARPDETQCACHWGDEEELALLKTPGVELDPGLLRRTWRATDWNDNAAVLRRVLPQLAAALVDGSQDGCGYGVRAGAVLAAADWQRWPAEQAEAVREFLHAWWARTLADARPAVPVDEVFRVCAEATGGPAPWLDVWGRRGDPVAGRHLAAVLDRWEDDLLADGLPFPTDWDDGEEGARAELTAWLVRHAPALLRAGSAPERSFRTVRLLGLTGPDRWDDPHRPGPFPA